MGAKATLYLPCRRHTGTNQKKEFKVRVLSLFDGMSCGLQALKNAGIKVSEYHAFEIDKAAIKISQKNHPEIIHHGSVVDADFSKFEGFDLVIAGSPCQGFSFVGKQLAFNDPRSKLFFEFVRALKEVKPKYFLLENVRMKQEFIQVITEHLGVSEKHINSSKVSAQERRRIYWTNINFGEIQDKAVSFGQIKEQCETPNSESWHKWWEGKKEFQLKKAFSKILSDDSKAICMVARQVSNWTGNLVEVGGGKLRFITPLEAERLQTLPDGYTEGVNKS